MSIKRIQVSAPGRICLFGEHQDYLNLPVITAAIDLRIQIKGKQRADRIFKLRMPDINQTDEINPDRPIEYLQERDYLRSALNVLLRLGVKIPCGYDCEIRGKIPINSGTSSSSALIVAWIKFLLAIAGDKRAENPMMIAKLAHQAEVLEFQEPGGMMDHYATSVGGILFINFENGVTVEKLPQPEGRFILADSKQAKDTKEILGRVKGGIFEILDQAKHFSQLTLKAMTLSDAKKLSSKLPKERQKLLLGTIKNRDITRQAYDLFNAKKIDAVQLGKLLSECQQILREDLKISTPKLDRMIDAAVKAGAHGGKLNGSGGGGCMFVNISDRAEQIMQAIEQEGGQPHLINVGDGVRTDFCEFE